MMTPNALFMEQNGSPLFPQALSLFSSSSLYTLVTIDNAEDDILYYNYFFGAKTSCPFSKVLPSASCYTFPIDNSQLHNDTDSIKKATKFSCSTLQQETNIHRDSGGGLAYRSKSCLANRLASAVEKYDVIAAYSAAMLGQKVARAQPPPESLVY